MNLKNRAHTTEYWRTPEGRKYARSFICRFIGHDWVTIGPDGISRATERYCSRCRKWEVLEPEPLLNFSKN